MKDEEILDSNKLIAIFMGGEYKKIFCGIDNTSENVFYMPNSHITDYVKDFKNGIPYHSSWDFLMPVVEKVRDSNCIVSIRFNRQLATTNTCIACFEKKWVKDIEEHGVGITSTYLAVLEFVKWYNIERLKQAHKDLGSPKTYF